MCRSFVLLAPDNGMGSFSRTAVANSPSCMVKPPSPITGPSGQHMTRSSELPEAIVQRKTRVLDFDLRAYFDNVRHDRLLAKVAQRVVVGSVSCSGVAKSGTAPPGRVDPRSPAGPPTGQGIGAGASLQGQGAGRNGRLACAVCGTPFLPEAFSMTFRRCIISASSEASGTDF